MVCLATSSGPGLRRGEIVTYETKGLELSHENNAEYDFLQNVFNSPRLDGRGRQDRGGTQWMSTQCWMHASYTSMMEENIIRANGGACGVSSGLVHK